MSTSTAFLELDQAWDEIFPRVSRKLSEAGLRVRKTFDLQAARQLQEDIPCPQHGPGWCGCQMLVLLIYREREAPVTLVVQGCGQSTWLTVVDIPGQRADPTLAALIYRLLTPAIPAPIRPSSESVFGGQAATGR